MLCISSVSLDRGGRRLLDEIHLDVATSRVTGVLGPNGAGKSSLLKVMSGEWRPTSGSVSMDGVKLSALTALQLAARRAVVPQSTSLAFPFTVRDLVLLGVTVPGFALPSDTRLARDALSEVGLEGFEHRNYAQLSGGERQRVHIARALVQLWCAPWETPEAKLLLLDEPTSSLDPAHQVAILRMLRARARDGWAITVVLHDLNLAAAWCDEVVLMRGGRIFARGAPPDVMTGATLSAVYGCRMVANAPPVGGEVYVLPHHIA